MINIFDGSDPVLISKRWLEEAEKTELNDANAMALASVDQAGMPNVRMVLLKEIDETGFIFYTNYNSVKATEIFDSGKVALVIHWKSLRRQIRVRGEVEKTSEEQADKYFNTRSLNSRYGAIASEQSKPLSSRDELTQRVAAVMKSTSGNPERPKYWGGFKIKPIEIELWADGEDRLHNRFRYTGGSTNQKWNSQRLFP
jgi:pyridoxamine 5'-phosphate oxidase